MSGFSATARPAEFASPTGTGQMVKALVTGIDLDAAGGPIAEVSMSTGQRDRVRLDQTTGRSGTPRVGEQWIIARPYGRWIFQMYLAPAVPRWTPLELLGTATNAPGRLPAAWLLDEQYELRLRGAITGVSGSLTDPSSNFAQLPDQARPPGGMRFLCHDTGSDTPAAVLGLPSGVLRLTAVSSGAAFVGLDQVRWLVDPAT